jgi:hypothetical protein
MASNTRWWEFYFVRYAIGTLVGAFVVNQIVRLSPSLREALLFGLGAEPTVPRATLLMGYGLLLCYIASVPILVLHAARFAIGHGPSLAKVSQSKPGKLFAQWRWLLCWIFAAFAALLIMTIAMGVARNAEAEGFLLGLILWAVLIVLTMEYVTAFVMLVYNDRVYAGMKRLAEARAVNDDRGGFIESYRHLREHGNSLFIVGLEVVLGAALIGLIRVIENDVTVHDKLFECTRWGVILLTAWMLPGIAVWFLGSIVERRFADERVAKAK